ncbi:ribosome biogenesis protein alb1 [Yamadazyma tenuis]|uniref:Ribosome biogenesis protein ALB1 n=1 Tax=Candida tenuis (strain ATCC 10573 / BCRC 21748 / CBS 615 / JCM 9827 / NBRC 10315 / NRRL Y-1498 / VKM Y-70) TaxID=590646 RepID=G3B4Q5_CANTC|nr:ribosome biogenesis protein ALB1 [Yamadazyma tenuis ATCC 10573]EGV63845.1 ribosome biogenesis protein ALB1 [Yamadazyma tenuis ATCC 10573]WEJ96541.1 ribosome biogenesis protein alb1 [Yamadazyma tenuis]
MPSRNSINKPKDKMLRNSHASSIGKKRASRTRESTRSATSRYNEDALPRPSDSRSIAVYTGNVSNPTHLTTNTLSNKKAKKLARNQKYVEKRLQKDLDDQMQTDEPKPINSLIKLKTKVKGENSTEKIRKALWGVVNGNDLSMFKVSPQANGTTVGVQSF